MKARLLTHVLLLVYGVLPFSALAMIRASAGKTPSDVRTETETELETELDDWEIYDWDETKWVKNFVHQVKNEAFLESKALLPQAPTNWLLSPGVKLKSILKLHQSIQKNFEGLKEILRPGVSIESPHDFLRKVFFILLEQGSLLRRLRSQFNDDYTIVRMVAPVILKQDLMKKMRLCGGMDILQDVSYQAQLRFAQPTQAYFQSRDTLVENLIRPFELLAKNSKIFDSLPPDLKESFQSLLELSNRPLSQSKEMSPPLFSSSFVEKKE